MAVNPRNSETRRLVLVLRENLRLKCLAGQAVSEIRLARKSLEGQRDVLAVLCEMLAFIRLSVAHLNAEGAGIAAASIVSGHDKFWRRLPAEIIGRVEERQRAIESAFLQKVVQPAWREGQSAALRVLAAQIGGTDAGVSDG